MPIRRKVHYRRDDAIAAPDTLFIFGDNLQRFGSGGQAKEMRGEKNAVGIVTKAIPNNSPEAFLNDATHAEQCIRAWDDDFARLKSHLEAGGTVVWPADGVGTGLAEMKKRAPKLWDELCQRTRELFRIAGQDDELIIIGAGGRDYSDWLQVSKAMNHVSGRMRLVEVIEGGAPGADRMCGHWADLHMGAVEHRTVPADWDGYRKRGETWKAGHDRNRKMAEMLVERREQTGARMGLLVFPGGSGTANMIETASSLGIRAMPIGQRPEHAAGVAAAITACNEGVSRQLTRRELAENIVDAYAAHAFPDTPPNETARHAAAVQCARLTSAKQPKTEYLVRDVIFEFSRVLLQPKPEPAPASEPAL